MPKRFAYSLAVLFTTALLASAPALAADGYPTQLRIGYQKGNSLVLLKSRGTLEKALAPYHVEVQWHEFAFGPPLVEGINAGSIDIGFVGAPPPVLAQAGAAPEVVYVGYSEPYQDNYAIVVPKGSTANSFADLKGKRIAVAKGSAGEYLLLSALDQAHWPLAAINEAYLGYSEGRAAFERGDVDAWVVPDPRLADTQLANGARAVLSARQLPPQYSFYIAPRGFAEQYPKALAQVLAQLNATEQYAKAHLDDAAQVLSDDTRVPLPVWRKALARQNWGVHYPFPAEVVASQQQVADTFYRYHLIPKPVRVADAVVEVKP
ncbi:aliphatic sulfonate ABC transporter substrate-binding protein [Pseudomonas typographi]|uniref:Aliphatic sulfonate ABC transporter substrate-binding protein n=1 Tax=Pseudomonas typographi TaxID=2715964 RepID=A0ABR7YX07_9PSED|nr:aliphatic sulfonate ABC transporter substrate-binding protein [Pseudomonas typographi]MBD1551236.1 aliphatic sulfonate ABC transporter substrate-binding protein [Pseudomonas typographi]MBD1586270.1 aliphatic sulfonate ABC transporter substrate-binding protein [Pseudomonas typographi]MBD1597742.1 aliphatic sulfonate ABC transporter substrate-binding protein [Pseudomonas typographi]